MTYDGSAAPASGYETGDGDVSRARTIYTGDGQCWRDDPERQLGRHFAYAASARRRCLAAARAYPVIFLDEIVKSFAISGDASQPGPQHALLEPESAGKFRNEYREIPIAADAVIWIAAIYSLDNIAPRSPTACWCWMARHPSPCRARCAR